MYAPMCSESDAGPVGQQTPAAHGVDKLALTRRGLLVGGAAMLLSACVRGGGVGRGTGMWYPVQAGDTLSQVSRRSGLPLERIIDENGLTSPELHAGMRLWLPGVTALAPESSAVAKAPAPSAPSTPKPTAPIQPENGSYEIVPRSAWTSEPIGPNHYLLGKVEKITVHHTDEHAGMAGLPDIEVVRRIERYHRGPEKRWAAIGYHYLVGKDGRIYEGRPVKYQGAHVSGNNENNLGISVIGDFMDHLPNAKQQAALKAFLDDQRARFSVPRSQVFGHREVHNTTMCPGDALLGWVKRYRQG